MNTISGVYRIVLLLDDRCYIGSSIQIQKRWSQHQRSLRKGTHHSPYLQRVWDKYGEDSFQFEIIEECDPEILIEHEQAWMDFYSPVFNTNPVAGNSLGFRHTEETKEKIREIRTGATLSEETKAKMSEVRMGHLVSASTRALLSEQRKGIPLPPDHPRRQSHEPEAIAKMSESQTRRWAKLREDGREPEVRANMSAAAKGNQNAKGRVLSPEHCAKISASKKGKPCSGPHTLWHVKQNIIEPTCSWCQEEMSMLFMRVGPCS